MAITKWSISGSKKSNGTAAQGERQIDEAVPSGTPPSP
jgi:hypothetical protein